MHVIKSTILECINRIKNKELNIVLFGSGTVCKTFIPYLDNKYNISDRILFIADNNIDKHGELIDINGKAVLVDSVTRINQYENYCILITNGDFLSVVNQLNSLQELDEVECYVLPIMQLERKYESTNIVYKDSKVPLIPKIIHYCWFSGKKMPYELEKCIDSWKEMCPDYEIIRWDENNYDITKNDYMLGACKKEKWGFIPDYARLEILYENGGFYFDTDVKIIKNLEGLRYQRAFCGRERVGHVNFGGGSGCEKHNLIVKELMEYRKNVKFIKEDGKLNTEASGFFETTPLMKKGLILEDINQKLDGINIYSSNYFSPYNYINGENIQNDNTFSIHYFKGSWIEGGNKLREETRKDYNRFVAKLEDIE